MRPLPHVDIDAIYVRARGLCFEAVLGPVSTDDLYRAIDGLGNRQNTIEKALARGYLRPETNPDKLGLLDLSSCRVTGTYNPLAACGYSRDKRRGVEENE